VEGRVEGAEKHFRITSVSVRYRFRIPHGKRAEADRALEIHGNYCPVHQSIKHGFEVNWSADMDEA
jgi:uncharacterized OsmC-like protein